MRESFNESLKINKDISWGMLKYGLCSYFALAYVNKYPTLNRFLAIMEYDEELEKEYLVHFLIIDENKTLIDAEGVYSNWRESVKEMTDIEFMELTAKEVDKSFIKEMIEKDIGFDKQHYETINNFVYEKY